MALERDDGRAMRVASLRHGFGWSSAATWSRACCMHESGTAWRDMCRAFHVGGLCGIAQCAVIVRDRSSRDFVSSNCSHIDDDTIVHQMTEHWVHGGSGATDVASIECFET